MVSLGFSKKIQDMVLKVIDETIGKKFPIIDEITDVFQEQENRFKEIEREISALKTLLKVIVKENNEQTCCCNKKTCS
tara:strand:- start:2002 stop:2235 length:234 start_codon:yes stop_codon:yes gene_type:complete